LAAQQAQAGEAAMKPENFEEKVVWWSIVGTYGFYVIGGLYILAPAIAWVLLGVLIVRLVLQTDETPPEDRISISDSHWVWVAGMVVMEVALIVGHYDYDIGMDSLIKSSIGWAKGWALLAVFPLLGCLKIRLSLLSRAACLVGVQTLLFFPFFVVAYLGHLPDTPYVSPLQAVGGPGPEFFALNLYEIDPSNGLPRWRLFTPWAPALGFVANIYFFLALEEEDKRWRWAGIAACVLMCVVSSSRLALLALPAVWLLKKLLSHLSHPTVLISLGFIATIAGIFSTTILDTIDSFSAAFSGARADSSRVRAALGRIAQYRWQTEAPIWGHGIVERGPHMVEYMPIGSHHTWYGLLFVKGIVGFVALAVPLLWAFCLLLVRAQKSKTSAIGLAMVMIILFYTFGENLEILAYLFWPGLVTLGIAFKSSTLPSHHEFQTPNSSPARG
jgi:hypothetical protein